MTVATAAAPDSFRLGMLLSDTRYRGYTIQVIAFFLLMLFFGWLITNTINNLAALGKEFGFSFLQDPASYDINQRLIEYSSRSSHARAAVVGILNTLLIAVLGCILATVIGVVAGVLRLSKNWLVARLMSVYIETVRNVPVLLQIILFSALINETFASPKKAEPWFDGGLVMTNRGFYFPEPLFSRSFGSVDIGGLLALSLDYVAIVVVIALSIYAGRLYGIWAHAKQDATGEAQPIFWVRTAILLAPLALLLVVLGLHFGYPELKGFNYKGGIFARESLIALWLALSIYTGAFIAENVRAGIQSVSHGQTEAAFALGLRPNRTMSLIILPQALRVIIPPLISQYLNLTKNSSLAIAVGYMDATGTLGGITLNQTGREMECLMLLMAFYLIVSLSISAVMNWYNQRVKLVER
ncbi:MAG: ABC transporter permease subunit [Alphaproteobacteria bacterium]|nr:ABC transporter permease subunit [Alphaproteobacteria bacterium]